MYVTVWSHFTTTTITITTTAHCHFLPSLFLVDCSLRLDSHQDAERGAMDCLADGHRGSIPFTGTCGTDTCQGPTVDYSHQGSHLLSQWQWTPTQEARERVYFTTASRLVHFRQLPNDSASFCAQTGIKKVNRRKLSRLLARSITPRHCLRSRGILPSARCSGRSTMLCTPGDRC